MNKMSLERSNKNPARHTRRQGPMSQQESNLKENETMGRTTMNAGRNRQRGQSIVLLALMMPALCGAMAFGVDTANLYYNWTRLQEAADAAAISGAGYLPGQVSKAVNTAKSYAQNN